MEEHEDNDHLVFEAAFPTADAPQLVRLERRIGLQDADGDYTGTVIACCWLWVRGPACEYIALPVAIGGYGASAADASDVPAFRAAVHASEAFVALSGS